MNAQKIGRRWKRPFLPMRQAASNFAAIPIHQMAAMNGLTSRL